MSIQPNNWENKTILIAEDEEMNYLLIEEIFRKSKAKIIRAINGKQVIELFKVHPEIDLILMDIKMPEISGYEATKIIKKIRNVPIIAQTAYAMAGEEKESQKAGCDAYITKPIKVKYLLEIAEKFLNN